MSDTFDWLADTRWTMSPVVWFATACAFHLIMRRIAK
jgi:hypothetical protein